MTLAVRPSPYWNATPSALPAELPQGLTCRVLTVADAPVVTALRREVLATLENPDYYNPAREVPGFVERHLEGHGITIGIFAEARLVAYGALGLPDPGEPNRAQTLPIPAAELASVGDMASVMVMPAFRYKGLHRWLIRWRLAEAAKRNRYHLVTHVSPNNYVSWHNLATYGLFAKHILRIANGACRFVIHRDLREQVSFNPASFVALPLTATDRMEEMMRSGLWVVSKKRDDDAWLALLGLPVIG